MKTQVSSPGWKLSPRSRTQALTMVEVMVIVVVAAVLIGMFLPVFSTTYNSEGMTNVLVKAKQIGLALKVYADDHDGVYPTGINAYGEPIRSSNDAFRSLFPTYTQSEAIFGNKLSAWQTSPPDNVISPVSEILKPGENVYAYVEGLNDKTSPPVTPLVVDGTDGTGHYVTKIIARGGVWKGTQAVVIRLDLSGSLESLTGPDNARYVRGPERTQNLLDVSYLGAGVRFLDPAAAPNNSHK